MKKKNKTTKWSLKDKTPITYFTQKEGENFYSLELRVPAINKGLFTSFSSDAVLDPENRKEVHSVASQYLNALPSEDRREFVNNDFMACLLRYETEAEMDAAMETKKGVVKDYHEVPTADFFAAKINKGATN